MATSGASTVVGSLGSNQTVENEERRTRYGEQAVKVSATLSANNTPLFVFLATVGQGKSLPGFADVFHIVGVLLHLLTEKSRSQGKPCNRPIRDGSQQRGALLLCLHLAS